MASAGLGARLKAIRESRRPAISRKALGEVLGFRGQSAYQLVYEWETDRRDIPSALMVTIARTLGVTICDLFGVEDCNSNTNDRSLEVVDAFASVVSIHLNDADREFLALIAHGLETYRKRLKETDPTVLPDV